MLVYSVVYAGPLNAFVASEPKIPDSLRLTARERHCIKTLSDLLAVRVVCLFYFIFFCIQVADDFALFFLCFPFPPSVFPTLQHLHRVQLQLQQDDAQSLADSIVIYNVLLNWFDFKIREFTWSADLNKHLFIEALEAGREKLRKWYAILTSGAAYSIAMGQSFFLFPAASLASSFLLFLFSNSFGRGMEAGFRGERQLATDLH